ncbi:efflux RND transporter periplasmic adaptor subunit [Xanthocytophaga flava]|uniref:efflux RND transporter periplasmic adaptor subunit n=1 Tax=Xanthocytophaga flava TaxID=3048013 RepID=UPI0028D5BDE1|nr:efflux RND transporter periplasmic adaptor subunit [Xanthocytophaga flavus]MDJ1472669.1 efflux RND transporter periplasmic adaptor subunit [Xanthocytophaga flavus]
MKNLRLPSYLVLLALELAPMSFVACQKAKSTTAAQKDDTSVAIQTASVKEETRTESVFTSGLISSDVEARLSFKTGGIIDKIYVKEGQKVSQGQLLATLNLTEINAQVQQARQSYEKAERDLQRVKGLYADTAATLEQLQNVTTAQEVARQNLTIAQFNQNYSQLRATTSGTVLKKLMNEGELASPGAQVLYVAATGQQNWVVRVGVSDKDWAKLSIGDKAKVTLDAYPNDAFEGTVTELAQAADPQNKLYEIEVQVKPGNKRFAPGLFARAEIIPNESHTYSIIPIEALVEGNGQQAFVYVVSADKHTVKKLPVRVAFFDNQRAMIASGLEGIKEVVTAGASFLTEGADVAVMNDSGTIK